MFNRNGSTHSLGLRTSSCSPRLRFTDSSANVAVRFFVNDFNRFFTEVGSCVSARFSPLLELEAPGVIAVPGGSPCSFSSSAGFSEAFLLLVFMQFWHCRCQEQEGQLQKGCPTSSTFWVFYSVSTTARKFSLTSCAWRFVMRFAYTTPSFVLNRCSSVRSLMPRHPADFYMSASFGAAFPDPFPPLEDEQAQIHQTPAPIHDSDPWHDRMGTVRRCP